MIDPEEMTAMSYLLDSITTACVTLSELKPGDARITLKRTIDHAASHIPPASSATVSRLRPTETKERPL